jgi:integrase
MKRFSTLTDEEIVKAIRGLEDYNCDPKRKPVLTALYTLLANLGLRISEATALRWRDVDFERREVSVGTLKLPGRAKGKKATQVRDSLPIDENTLATLLVLKKPETHPNELIFQGISRRVAYNIFQRVLHLACIRPVKVHALRHSAVTRWLEDTGDLAFAQFMARHRSVTSTAQYVHVTKLKEKFEKVRKIQLESPGAPPTVNPPARPPSPPKGEAPRRQAAPAAHAETHVAPPPQREVIPWRLPSSAPQRESQASTPLLVASARSTARRNGEE